jgi:hypothetical protein
MAKVATLSSIAAQLMGIAKTQEELADAARSVSQNIAARIVASGMDADDRNTEAAATFRDKLNTAIRNTDGASPERIAKALNVAKTQLCFAWNIVQGKGDENGRTLPTKKGANVATKKESTEKASAPAVKQVQMQVTRDAAIAYMASAMGGDQQMLMYCFNFLIDNNVHMRSKFLKFCELNHVPAEVKKAA